MILISYLHLRIVFSSALLVAVSIPLRVVAQGEPSTTARRIADVATIALDEYREGVMGGRVVREDELREARLFLEEARRAAGQLPEEARGEALRFLEDLVAGVMALRSESDLRHLLVGLREALERTLDVTLDLMPTRAPSLQRGEALYAQHCRQCHGEGGSGDGVLAEDLDPPPADLTDRDALRTTSPVDFFRKLNVGVAGTAMPGFNEQLGLDDRWDLALYSSTLRFAGDPRAAGEEELTSNCPYCRLLVSDFRETAALSDDSLAVVIAEQSGLAEGLSDAVVLFARVAGAAELLGNDRALAAARTVARAKARVVDAMELAAAGDRPGAAARALDAYLVFEQIETAVRARDSKAARRVEQAFTQFRGSLLARRAWADVLEARGEVDASLDGALARVNVTASPAALFGQSFVIMLREGLEAILIVGALIAFLVRAGASQHKRDIGWGVLAAVGASLVTAAGFATLFRSATRHQEVLEGITMLVAAGVLFWVSYWLISKIELQKWQAFVRAQMQKALTSRRALALAAVAFLAVYREGFETVLFYAALFTTSDGSAAATAGIIAGLGVGFAALCLVYFLMQRYSVRLPLKPFFAITSSFLYIMAFSFAGQGVAELQEAGVVSITPLDWVPAVPALGIFPTTQTLVSQLLIATALVGALLWVFWLQPRVARVRE